jgi:hypothetical protein
MPDIKNPKLRQLYEYWDGKRGERQMPSRADLDPLDMTYAMGNVILVDVTDETPQRFHIRLHGTNLAERAGYELTGKMLDELPVTEFRGLAQQSFTHVARTGAMLHLDRDRLIDGRARRYETIIMPLSTDGARVDRLLIGLVYDDENR